MHARKPVGLSDIDHDDAPELTATMLEDAEVFDGDQFVRRGRGRPRSESPKEKVNVRIDADVLERLRVSGPGWQTRVNSGLAMLVGVDKRLWDWIDSRIAYDEEQIEDAKHAIQLMEDGVMRSFTNGEDTTLVNLQRNKNAIEQLTNAIEAMRAAQLELLGPGSPSE